MRPRYISPARKLRFEKNPLSRGLNLRGPRLSSGVSTIGAWTDVRLAVTLALRQRLNFVHLALIRIMLKRLVASPHNKKVRGSVLKVPSTDSVCNLQYSRSRRL